MASLLRVLPLALRKPATAMVSLPGITSSALSEPVAVSGRTRRAAKAKARRRSRRHRGGYCNL